MQKDEGWHALSGIRTHSVSIQVMKAHAPDRAAADTETVALRADRNSAGVFQAYDRIWRRPEHTVGYSSLCAGNVVVSGVLI
jgi:hypothetical protein